MDGYRIDIECDDQSLRVRSKNNAARVALTGKNHGDGALVIPRSAIFGVKFKAASMFAKGKLSVSTKDGHKYRMYCHRRQQPDFERLAQQLNADLWQRFTTRQLHLTTPSHNLADRTSHRQVSVSDLPSQDDAADRDRGLG